MSNLDSMVRTTVSFIGNATNSARAAMRDDSNFSEFVLTNLESAVNDVCFRFGEIARELIDDDDPRYVVIEKSRARFTRVINGEEPDPRESRHESKPVVHENVAEIAAAAAEMARNNAAAIAAQRAAELEAMLNAGYVH